MRRLLLLLILLVPTAMLSCRAPVRVDLSVRNSGDRPMRIRAHAGILSKELTLRQGEIRELFVPLAFLPARVVILLEVLEEEGAPR